MGQPSGKGDRLRSVALTHALAGGAAAVEDRSGPAAGSKPRCRGSGAGRDRTATPRTNGGNLPAMSMWLEGRVLGAMQRHACVAGVNVGGKRDCVGGGGLGGMLRGRRGAGAESPASGGQEQQRASGRAAPSWSGPIARERRGAAGGGGRGSPVSRSVAAARHSEGPARCRCWNQHAQPPHARPPALPRSSRMRSSESADCCSPLRRASRPWRRTTP